MIRWLFVILFLGIIINLSYAQNCSPSVPIITVDLSPSADTTWVSPIIQRLGQCCGVNDPDVCVEFIIFLNSNSQGINFNIYSGAVPGGAMFYQINCGPPVVVGQPICLSGVGPHILTFCKPGNNTNQYSITSIPNASVSPNIVINEGCVGNIFTTGLTPSSIIFNSIYPSSFGAYNSYLSCPSGCSSTQVTGQLGYPPYVDYQVCGSLAGNCSTVPFCDTVRVTFNSALNVQIQPNPATLCFGQTSITLTATGSGGSQPYSFTWSTGQTSQSIQAGVGTYTVIMHDATNCPPVSASINVTAYPNPIQANAGVDQQVCKTIGNVQLNGSVVSASGGIWSGGQGSFAPSNQVLNSLYYPTINEINNGFVNLILTTIGNGSCPSVSDTVHISFVPFMGNTQIIVQSTNCFQSADGSANINISGGNGPYSYLWNTQPSSTNAQVVNLLAGTYTVTIIDALGCLLVETATIAQPTELQAFSTIVPPSCYLGANGIANVIISGGTPAYSIQWSNNSFGYQANNLSSGNYFYTITDSKGCSKAYAITVNQPDSIFIETQVINPTCYQSPTGSIQLNISGGTAPYLYTWIPSSYSGSNLQNLPAGIYFVTVTDSKGCTSTKEISISQPNNINLSVNYTAPTCYGSYNGIATAIVTGGTSPYFYIWSPYGGNQPTANNIGAGTFTVTIYDANGCSAISTVSISQPPPLLAQNNWVHNVSCYGGNDGIASVSVSGGTPPYSYLWQPSGGFSNTSQPLSAGNYLASITDIQGCVIQQNITITQPLAALTVQLNAINVSCYGGSNGSITANTQGGTPPYNYQWSPIGNSTSFVNNLITGTYYLTVTDFKGCTATASINITSPQAILINTSNVPSICGGSSGSATVNVSGGNLPYSYFWTPGNFMSSTIINISSGIYNVTVTDATNCTAQTSILVNDVGAPSLIISDIQNVSCFGGNDGSVTVVPNGGAPPYTYTWYPYGGVGPIATGLSAGTFYVTVTDLNGCIATQMTNPSISQPNAIQLFSSKVDVSCNGSSNGQASVSAIGGTPPYSYLWQPGGNTLSNITNLSPGIYRVTVTDSKGCAENTFITINEPFMVQINVTSLHHISCYNGNDGSISLQILGGTPPYNYLWSPSNYTSSQINNLSSGTHTAYITDANGCAKSISVVLNQPTPLSLFLTKSDALCNQGLQGSVTALCSGGIPPYSYQWSPANGITQTEINVGAGIHFVTVTDNLGCSISNSIQVNQPMPLIPVILQIENVKCFNGSDGYVVLGTNGGTPPYSYHWNNGQTTPYLSNLSSGTYYCTVTDVNSCTSVLDINITAPSAILQISTVTSPTSCFQSSDGMVSVTATGGTPPYSYLWIPSGNNNSTVSNLLAGNYTVSVFDNNQCIASSNVQVSEPTNITGSVQTLHHVNCYGEASGEITVFAQGGTPPYSYQWNTFPQQNTQIAQNVFAGQYSVTVIDSKGCSWIGNGVIEQPPSLQSQVSLTPPSCYQGNNGTAWISMAGGTPTYTYEWNTNPVQNSFIANQLTAGTYYVTVYDNHGCQIIDSCIILQPTQIITSTIDSLIICKGDSVELIANASGGVGNYLYYWNNFQFGQNIWVSPSHSTTYIVFAFDSIGCEGTPDTCTVIVKDLYPSNVELYANTPICPGNYSLIYVTANANHYDTLYYAWSNQLGPGAGAFVITPTTPTTYYVTISNTCNVEIIDSIKITFKDPPTIHFDADSIQGCQPLTVSFIDSSYTSYDYINQWNWNFGDNTNSIEPNPTHTFLLPGTYYVSLEVETNAGCINNNTQSPLPIYVFENPTATFSTNKDIYYLPNDPVICTNLSTGAVGYMWNFGDGTISTQENPINHYNDFGNFQIILVAINTYQCTDTAYKNINISGDIIFPNAFTPNANTSSGGGYDIADYSNQIFFPISQGIEKFKMQIFNRWGELIFETNNIAIGWDGYYRNALCQQDVYVYKASAVFIDGRKVEKVGDVLLIR